jgi:hypothetical protein
MRRWRRRIYVVDVLVQYLLADLSCVLGSFIASSVDEVFH